MSFGGNRPSRHHGISKWPGRFGVQKADGNRPQSLVPETQPSGPVWKEIKLEPFFGKDSPTKLLDVLWIGLLAYLEMKSFAVRNGPNHALLMFRFSEEQASGSQRLASKETHMSVRCHIRYPTANMHPFT